MERDYGSGNEAHSHAVKVMVERFCSPGVCYPQTKVERTKVTPTDSPAPPKRCSAKTSVDPSSTVMVHDTGGAAALDGQLLDHVKATTHFVVADGALDGQIALEAVRASVVRVGPAEPLRGRCL